MANSVTSVGSAVGAANAGADAIDAQNVDVAELMRQQTSLGQQIAKSGDETAVAANLVYTQKAQGELAVQTASVATARAMGGDIRDTKTDLITPLTSRLRDLDAQSEAAYDDYTKRNETNFFDNPMAWFGNHVMGGTEAARKKYADIATKFNNTNARLEGVLKGTQEGQIAARASETTLSQESIEAGAKVAAFEYTKAADLARWNMLGANLAGIKELREGNYAAVQLRLKAWDEQRAAEVFGMEQSRFAMAKKEFEDKQGEKNLVQSAFTAGLAALDKKMPDGMNLERVWQLSKTKEGNAEIGAILAIGIHSMSTMDPRTKTPDIRFGATTGDVVFNLLSTQTELSDNNRYKEGTETAMMIWNDLTPKAGLNRKDHEAVKAKIDEATKLYLETALPNNEGNSKSPFRDHGFSAALADTPTLANTTFWKTVIAPIAVKQDTMSAADITKLAYNEVKAGKMKIEEAANGLSQYYQTVRLSNSLYAKASGLGIQEKFNAKALSGKVVDLSDPTVTRREIVEQYARETEAKDVVTDYLAQQRAQSLQPGKPVAMGQKNRDTNKGAFE